MPDLSADHYERTYVMQASRAALAVSDADLLARQYYTHKTDPRMTMTADERWQWMVEAVTMLAELVEIGARLNPPVPLATAEELIEAYGGLDTPESRKDWAARAAESIKSGAMAINSATKQDQGNSTTNNAAWNVMFRQGRRIVSGKIKGHARYDLPAMTPPYDPNDSRSGRRR